MVTIIFIGCFAAALLYGLTLEALAKLGLPSTPRRWTPFMIVAVTWGAATALQMAGAL